MARYIFILCPPYSGSTVLWKFLQSSNNVSALPMEGQLLDPIKDIMHEDPYSLEKELPWNYIRQVWEKFWDLNKPLLLEKSPPNLMRAKDIEKNFEDTHFIAMVRNPYATCHGINRRGHMALTQAAEFWVMCAKKQKQNLETLKNITFFTYESFTESRDNIKKIILESVPELVDLDTDITISVHYILGRSPSKIRNLNSYKICRFTNKQIIEINKVLKEHTDIMGYFGYQYIDSSFMRSIKRNMTIFENEFTDAMKKFQRILHK